MKILYFGTICDLFEYEKIIKECHARPTIATIVFESALLSGFKCNNADVTVYSFPMIPTFPNSRILFWGRRKQQLKCGYSTKWLRTINLPIIKQITRRLDGKAVLRRWAKINKDTECAIITYSIPPFLVKEILKIRKKYSIPCYAIIPDLPRDMYMNQDKIGFVAKLKEQYLKPSIALQGMFDGYIYLTEAMSEVINPERPYVVMEGILDTTGVEKFSDAYTKANDKLTIMYAGGIHEKYGVLTLIDAFERIDRQDIELWLFGDGSCKAEVIERTKKNPKVCYFGTKPREDVIRYEKIANVLVNPRSPKEEYTKYSFPSKIIEYMFSGTPLLTTKLPGIPIDYFPYLFTAEGEDAVSLAHALEEILSLPDEIRRIRGMEAKEFIINKKNSCNQAKRVLDFIKGRKS